MLLILSLAAVAQQEQVQGVELDPVTVTATLAPVQAAKTGRNLFVIQGEALRRLPVHSIDELLRYLPGLEVQSRGPMGAQSNITIRGGTFQQVLILLDGIRLNDPLTGHFNSYIPIASAEIERIEILKGASSAIYGTEAVGGVVHIISKTFAALKGKREQQLQAQVTTGQFGLRNAQTGFRIQREKTSVSGGLQQNVADGQTLRGTKGFFNLSTLSLSARHFFSNNWSAAYRGAYDDRTFNAQNFYTQLLSDSATEQVISRWHHFNVTYQQGKHRLSIDAGYKNTSDKFQLRKSLPANTNRSGLAQAQVMHTVQLSQASTFSSGAQWIGRSVRSNNRGNHEISTAGAFAVLHQQLGKYFLINPAIRADWNERYGWELIPQLNVSYRRSNLQLRGSAGRSTRDADFTERFNNYQPALVASGNRMGNPFLDAESAFSYEAGADFFIQKKWKISTGWFQRFHSGLIDYVLTPYAQMPRKDNLVPGGVYNLARNLSQVNTRGWETDIQFHHSFASKHQLSINTGFIWMKSTTEKSEVPSLYVSNHARFLLNYSLQYRYQSLGISMNGLYKQRSPQTGNAAFVPLSKDYFLLNLQVQGYFLNDQLGVFLQADNLLNRRYADILGTVMPGSWLMGGIKVTLQ
jgi:iron complex outermembrane receptor protein